MCNNPNLDLVNINAYVKFRQNASISSQDIEQKYTRYSKNNLQVLAIPQMV